MKTTLRVDSLRLGSVWDEEINRSKATDTVYVSASNSDPQNTVSLEFVTNLREANSYFVGTELELEITVK